MVITYSSTLSTLIFYRFVADTFYLCGIRNVILYVLNLKLSFSGAWEKCRAAPPAARAGERRDPFARARPPAVACIKGREPGQGMSGCSKAVTSPVSCGVPCPRTPRRGCSASSSCPPRPLPRHFFRPCHFPHCTGCWCEGSTGTGGACSAAAPTTCGAPPHTPLPPLLQGGGRPARTSPPAASLL